MSNMTETTKPLFLEYFKENFVHKTSMIDVPVNIKFLTKKAGTLNFTTDININGAGYLSKKNIVAGKVDVDIAVANSDFFNTFNKNGDLVSALRLTLSKGEAVRFEKRQDIRVDGGQFIVCDLDFVAHIGELQTKAGLGQDADYGTPDVYDLLQEGRIPGSSLTVGLVTEHSQELIVDDRRTVEINSGYGDGTYPLYLAYDVGDNLLAAYVDFLLFERHDVLEQIIERKKNLS